MKRLISYLFPISVKKFNSSINGILELNIVDGKFVLDTEFSNYSYGSLQKILHTGLQAIKFNNNIRNILILGLGGGSVIQTIRETFKSDALIVAVDKDPKIIDIAINEFNINRFQNVNIIQADALSYTENANDTFDLIIVDIFIGDTIPKIFTEIQFINQIANHLNRDGKLIFNTMRNTIQSEIINQIKNEFLNLNCKVQIIERVEGTNDLIIAEKLPLTAHLQ
jgi:spermidine synthase